MFPETARWWLEYYRDFADELRRDYGEIIDAAGTCIVFGLSPVVELSSPASGADSV